MSIELHPCLALAFPAASARRASSRSRAIASCSAFSAAYALFEFLLSERIQLELRGAYDVCKCNTSKFGPKAIFPAAGVKRLKNVIDWPSVTERFYLAWYFRSIRSYGAFQKLVACK